MLDARKTSNDFVPVKVNNEPAEVVCNFKTLRTLIDSKLSVSGNTDLIYYKNNNKNKQTKTKKCLYLMHKQRCFDVNHELLQTVYKSLVQTVLIGT